MTMPELPAKASRRELRKTLLRMRLQMHRQELRHETLVMLQPLRQAQYWRNHWREELGNSNAPLWVAGGALLLATVLRAQAPDPVWRDSLNQPRVLPEEEGSAAREAAQVADWIAQVEGR